MIVSGIFSGWFGQASARASMPKHSILTWVRAPFFHAPFVIPNCIYKRVIEQTCETCSCGAALEP